MEEEQQLEISPTVEHTRKQLGDQTSVYAVDVVESILAQHTEYAEKTSRPELKRNSDAQQRPVDDWLAEVRLLFNTNLAPELHGRLVIIGLSMVDSDLKQQLQESEFMIALEKELKEPLDSILTEQGRKIWDISKSKSEPAPTPESDIVVDSVPNYPDDPLQNLEDDQLGRAAYGRYLTERLLTVPQDQAYAIHIYGPWGAGKTTLLNFLRAQLEKKQWLVVEFNAWRNQHIRPPWWAMLDRVFQDSQKPNKHNQKPLAGWDLIREYTWRLAMGRAHYFLGLFVLALVIALGFWYFSSTGESDTGTMSFWVTLADNLGTILATVVAIWAAVQAISRSMVIRSSQTAQSYMETTADPMGQMAARFRTLIKRIKADRVAIFIDDLDRCESAYVVDLLEGIQTLFREAPVIFVVAADHRWLDASFEEVYDELQLHVQEPGKPLGTLFLEKVFQFATPVPGISLPLREVYWRHLLHMKKVEPGREVESARASAKAKMDQKQSEDEMLDTIDQSDKQPWIEQQALREEMIVKMASPEIMADIENHTLAPFAPLLEPNPRAMKRLVNTYSVNRSLSTLGHLDIPKEQLALWTILAMRWPKLAEHLEEQPEDILRISENEQPDGNSSISKLFDDEEVIKVVQGGGVAAGLDVKAVERCALLRM